MQIGNEVRDNFCANVSCGNQLADAREAHRDERKFRSGEKTVERYEKQHAKQANDEHTVRILPGSIVAAETS